MVQFRSFLSFKGPPSADLLRPAAVLLQGIHAVKLVEDAGTFLAVRELGCGGTDKASRELPGDDAVRVTLDKACVWASGTRLCILFAFAPAINSMGSLAGEGGTQCVRPLHLVSMRGL